MTLSRVVSTKIIKVNKQQFRSQADLLAVEEPLEIRLGFGSIEDRQEKSLAITMRTPGHDFELTLGFLISEGMIQSASDALSIKYCQDRGRATHPENIVRVELIPDIQVDIKKLARHFYTSSSCGVCGKASIESIQVTACPYLAAPSWQVSSDLIIQLPEKLREAQAVFKHTGALHATALFNQSGELLQLREDIGRHNAMDKIIGWASFQNKLPLGQNLALLSGRISFELVQKALVGGIPILVAIGAPSSLAVDLAQEFGMTLIGFVRSGSFNIYTHSERIQL